ncbi:MAG: HDIG domain-containing protein [bacterium]|nr:HDIG domain-containing protein [bacterium]
MTFKLNFFNPSKSLSKGKKKTSVFDLISGLILVLILAYIIYIPQQKAIVHHELKVGDIATENIVIKKDTNIQDKESTEANRKRAIENVVPVYVYLAANQTRSEALLKQWFKLIRNTKKEVTKNKEELNAITNKSAELGPVFSSNEIKSILKSQFFRNVDLIKLLKKVRSLYEKGILASLKGAKRSKEGTIKLVSKRGEPVILKIEELYDLKGKGVRIRTELNRFIKEQDISGNSTEFIASILMKFISTNIYHSPDLTGDEEDKAANAVNPVLLKMKTGKVILRKGDEVSVEDLKILKLIASQDEKRERKLSNFYLILVILMFLWLFGTKFFKTWQSGSVSKEKIFIVTSATLTVSAIIYRACIFLYPLILRNLSIDVEYNMYSIFFALPFAFGVLAMAFIFDLQSAVIFSFVNSIIGAIICNWDFKIAVYILLGNLAVSFGIEFYQRLKRSPIIKASILWMLPINIVMIVVYNLTDPNATLQLIMVNVVMGFCSALVAPILANFIIPLWETLFKLVTELKLIELTNLNLPIFREMLEKAPGTYHHSQMVASLAEAAALDVGLSPLVQTAMALYHDIGKIDSPHFFTENHSLYKNPHDNLSARDSSKNIINHITLGMERAAKLKLPAEISSAIVQHHGTKMVRFFYDKAREMSTVDSDGFEDNAFRYQGEKPKNIENAIMMLADQVEAASKSLASPSDEEIKNVIRKIIVSNIEENQFDDCEGLTFKALNTIANSFHKKLSSIYHMRVSYPGFDFKKKEKKENEESR